MQGIHLSLISAISVQYLICVINNSTTFYSVTIIIKVVSFYPAVGENCVISYEYLSHIVHECTYVISLTLFILIVPTMSNIWRGVWGLLYSILRPKRLNVYSIAYGDANLSVLHTKIAYKLVYWSI